MMMLYGIPIVSMFENPHFLLINANIDAIILIHDIFGMIYLLIYNMHILYAKRLYICLVLPNYGSILDESIFVCVCPGSILYRNPMRLNHKVS